MRQLYMIFTSDPKETCAFILYLCAVCSSWSAEAPPYSFSFFSSRRAAAAQNQLHTDKPSKEYLSIQSNCVPFPSSAHMLKTVGQPGLGSQTSPTGRNNLSDATSPLEVDLVL